MTLDDIDRQLSHDPESILVITWMNRIVGCVFMTYGPVVTYVFNLYVIPDERRSGFGSQLMMSIEAIAHNVAIQASDLLTLSALHRNGAGRSSFQNPTYSRPS
jgi:N-acetylglutamate synthase-like GNAT family acetyltransferase